MPAFLAAIPSEKATAKYPSPMGMASFIPSWNIFAFDLLITRIPPKNQIYFLSNILAVLFT